MLRTMASDCDYFIDTTRIVRGAGSMKLFGRPSVCLAVPSFGRRVCCCGPGGQEISIDCCTAGAQRQIANSVASTADLRS